MNNFSTSFENKICRRRSSTSTSHATSFTLWWWQPQYCVHLAYSPGLAAQPPVPQARGRRKCRSPQQSSTGGLDPWTPRREDSKGSDPESWGDFRSLTDAPIARLESLDEMESLPVSPSKPNAQPLTPQPPIVTGKLQMWAILTIYWLPKTHGAATTGFVLLSVVCLRLQLMSAE